MNGINLSVYYYTRDHEASVREMCSSTGAIVSRMAYDPYGRVTIVSGTTLPTMQYAGYYQHTTSGLELTQFRAYDANTGRWLSRDPLGEAVGPNQYAYVTNDPTYFVDPIGLDEVNTDINASVFSSQNDPGNNGELSYYTNKLIDDDTDLGVALPSYNLRGKCVEITNKATGKSVVAPVIDVGPNHPTNREKKYDWVNPTIDQYVDGQDPYWLAHTRPEAESDGSNGAGIDLTPATDRALGIPVKVGHSSEGPEWQNPGKLSKVDWKFVPCCAKK